MARLRKERPVADLSSEESESSRTELRETNYKVDENAITKLRTSPRKIKPKSYRPDEFSVTEDSTTEKSPALKPKTPTQQRQKQIRLAPLNDVTLFSKEPSSSRKHTISTTVPLLGKGIRAGRAVIDSDVEESVWCGSDPSSDESDEELPSPRTFILLSPKRPNNSSRLAVKQPEKPSAASSRPASSSDKENDGAFLRFSPPCLHSPRKPQITERPVTPPQSPTKSRLQSPTKARSRAPPPTPPQRQSLDTFWNSNAVNDWNDQYSPQKILKSPKKLKFLKDETLRSPTSSPRKAQSPSKATRDERDAKKTFDLHKRTMAEAFFNELDQVVTEGKIRELTASTGGVQFIWSKTLNSTAGRANWRKETLHIRILDGTTEVRHKHHASIELAEKVIDDENRLLNVIAHEFCHLANFMVSGIKNEPHGRQFKAWGRKCTAAFKDRGVEVTTKHSYQIEYKYIWQCSNEVCAVEFKRHSKSIDPKRHTCGTCRSKLIQIKPTPRRDAGTATGYAAYVKAHFAEVKRSMPSASQKEVMEAVGKKYRAEKASTDLDIVVEKLQVINLKGARS